MKTCLVLFSVFLLGAVSNQAVAAGVGTYYWSGGCSIGPCPDGSSCSSSGGPWAQCACWSPYPPLLAYAVCRAGGPDGAWEGTFTGNPLVVSNGIPQSDASSLMGSQNASYTLVPDLNSVVYQFTPNSSQKK